MKLYVAKEVICPFYSKESASCIYCEGVGEGSSTMLHFPSKEHKKRHKQHFCSTFDKHTFCPLYEAINKKYRGWEDG